MHNNDLKPELDINYVWLNTVRELLQKGKKVCPRGFKTKELLGYQTKVDMRFPILGIPKRKLGRRFQTAEAAWIISGDDRVATIAPYSKAISNFSDDGVKFFGSYGVKIREQINYVVEKLATDQDTREAVINIWRENPPQTKDYPCTCTVQFLIRDGKIHCVDNMRSSDIWLGWPYDIFNFSMLSGFIALKLREEYGIKLELGTITLNAGSQHIYEQHFDKAQECWIDPKMESYSRFDLDEFTGPYDLLQRLWNVANKKPVEYGFLHEFNLTEENK